MDILKALGIFEFKVITELNRDELRKRYRKTLKKYHPDNNNGDDTRAVEIIKAYETLLGLIKQVEAYENMVKASKKQSIISILHYEVINNIYNGTPITLGNGEDSFELNKSEMLKNEIYMTFRVYAGIRGGVKKEFNNTQKINLMRRYSIVCDIEVPNLESIELEVEAYGNSKCFKVDYDALRFDMKLDNNIIIEITLRKKIVTDKPED